MGFDGSQQLVRQPQSPAVTVHDNIVNVQQWAGGKGGEAEKAVDQSGRLFTTIGKPGDKAGKITQPGPEFCLGNGAQPRAAAHRVMGVVVEQGNKVLRVLRVGKVQPGDRDGWRCRYRRGQIRIGEGEHGVGKIQRTMFINTPDYPRRAKPMHLPTVDEAILRRRSVRAFLPTPVAPETLMEILQLAGHAPSGTNIQPWKAYVLQGQRKTGLSEKILAAFNDPEEAETHQDEYGYYPKEWFSPYIDRRRKVGFDMYKLLGIGKGETARMHEQHGRNYLFFDAPVGLIFTIDRKMQQGSWMDYGMFLQTLMLAAKGRGLDTCPQVSFAKFHRIIGEHLQLPENEMFVCAMALGYADPEAPVNQLKTERAPLAEWVKVCD